MNPIVKKLLQLLLSAVIGSGITIAITDNFSVKCSPVINNQVGDQ